MTATENKPLVVGCGLTGMVISDRLTRAGIPHVLLGDPPDDRPRLGESLDPAGTLELLESYPEFDDFYYKKRRINVFAGDYATTCDFGQTLARTFGLRMMGFESPPEFLDVDRVGFDEALYEEVVASDYCLRLESLVDSVDYDPETDAVEAVHLESGETTRPSYVFDCTNFVRLLGRALDVPVEWLGDPQRVVFTDYPASDGAGYVDTFDDKVVHADHLVRLYDDIDGLDGAAWAIPIGSYVSVGISMPKERDAPEADAVLERVEDAYRRRGLDLLDVVGDPKPPVDIPHQQYFIHERAYGRNWLLAGPSYGQFWFPSASGVGTSLVAATLAPRILDRPEEAGRQYQNYVDGLQDTHYVFDRLISRNHDEITRELVETESSRIIAENVKRVGRLAMMRKGPLARGAARLFMKVASYDGFVEGNCSVYNTDMARQTQTILEHE